MSAQLIRAAVAALAGVALPATLHAQRLGGGAAPEVSIVRIVGALIICLLVALLAALYLRHRSGRPFALQLGRLVHTNPEIDVRETRRLTVQHSVSLVRHGGREYLLLLSPGDGLVLGEREVPGAEPHREAR